MKHLFLAVSFLSCLVACGGDDSIYYPFQTVYGDVCRTMEPTPGCTFNRDGTRVTVEQDPYHDDSTSSGSGNIMNTVHFNANGTADVYDHYGVYLYSAPTSSFSGWISGNTIGVGTTGLFWENVAGGNYWLGKNGVLYSQNGGDSNFKQAINSDASVEASDTNFAAISMESNKTLIRKGSEKLMKEYGFRKEKAQAVASALNSWAVSVAERGYTTEKDMDRTFAAVFGVKYSSALAAIRDLQAGDKAGMRELTNRSASALGLQPYQAQQFIKGMYARALAEWGYDVNNLSW
jgi:hypothetical protein